MIEEDLAPPNMLVVVRNPLPLQESSWSLRVPALVQVLLVPKRLGVVAAPEAQMTRRLEYYKMGQVVLQTFRRQKIRQGYRVGPGYGPRTAL